MYNSWQLSINRARIKIIGTKNHQLTIIDDSIIYNICYLKVFIISHHSWRCLRFRRVQALGGRIYLRLLELNYAPSVAE